MTKKKVSFLDELCQRIVASVHALKIGSSPEHTAAAVRGVLRKFFSVSAEGVPAKVAPRKPAPSPKKQAKRSQRKKSHDPAVTEDRATRILGVVGQLGTATVKQVIDTSGLASRGIVTSLNRLVEKGRLQKTSDGAYQIAS